MIATAKQLRSKFTDLELARMFNVELATKNGKLADVDGCQLPLWKVERRDVPVARRGKVTSLFVDGPDKIRSDVTDAMPGSPERIAVLAAFYAENDMISPFED